MYEILPRTFTNINDAKYIKVEKHKILWKKSCQYSYRTAIHFDINYIQWFILYTKTFIILLLTLKLCYFTDLRNQNLSNKIQYVNGSLSIAERFRRLVPYVTYYVVGNNDNDDEQYRYRNPNPSKHRPLPANNFYYENEGIPQRPQQKQPTQYQQNYQIPNHQYQQYTTPQYLRFPTSQKIRKPIVIATTEMPQYTVQTEKSYDYYYDYSQTTLKPILKPNPIKYEYGFLPTIPPTPYSPPEQEFFSTKPKKLKIPKPKIPTPIITTTTTDKYGALNEILNGYDLGNRLSNKITPENIGSSIQTLSAVLQILQNEADEQIKPKKPQPEYNPDSIDEYDTGDLGNQGRPGTDYPTLSVIPKTRFDCKTQRYKGFFGDPETRCQVLNVFKNALKDNILRVEALAIGRILPEND